MAAASALKTGTIVVAICVAMLLVQTTVGLGYPTTPTAQAPAGGGLACPDAQSACRTNCRTGCDGISPAMCQAVCAASPLPEAGKTCVDKVLSVCQTFCKTACETISSA